MDNFRPYLEGIRIGANYVAQWTLQGTSILLSRSTDLPFDKGKTYPVVLTFSEPLQSASLTVSGVGAVPLSQDVADRRIFRGNIAVPAGSTSTKLTLTVQGTDAAGNKSLAIDTSVTTISASQICRSSAGLMQGTPGYDTAHSMKLGTPEVPASSPIDFRGLPSADSVDLTWAPPATQPGGVRGYRIFRREVGVTPSCTGADRLDFEGSPYCSITAELPASTLAYTDADVYWGSTYGYAMHSVSLSGMKGAVAGPVVVTAADEPVDVPGRYSTISAALSATSSGQVIVGPGTYHESSLAIKPGVRLKSKDGPGSTIIDAGSSTLVIAAEDNAQIIGFTLSSNKTAGKGIDCSWDTGVFVSNNIFLSNDIGVHVMGSTSTDYVRMFNNVFASNDVAVYSYQNGYAYLMNNVFWDNGLGLYLWMQSGCHVYYNAFKGSESSEIDINPAYPDTSGHSISNNRFGVSCPFIDYVSATPANSDFRLDPASVLVDAGKPDVVLDPAYYPWLDEPLEWVDPDGSPADMGAYGGPYADWGAPPYGLRGAPAGGGHRPVETLFVCASDPQIIEDSFLETVASAGIQRVVTVLADDACDQADRGTLALLETRADDLGLSIVRGWGIDYVHLPREGGELGKRSIFLTGVDLPEDAERLATLAEKDGLSVSGLLLRDDALDTQWAESSPKSIRGPIPVYGRLDAGTRGTFTRVLEVGGADELLEALPRQSNNEAWIIKKGR